MELTKILKIILIINLTVLIFLSAIHLAGFNESFYREEFLKYNVENNVPKATELHQNAMEFIKGKSYYLPDIFNEREKNHLKDVRRLVLLSKAALYTLIFLFFILIIASKRLVKSWKNLKQFIGKALLFGGLLTIFIAILLFLLVNFNFYSSFESFHKIFFQPGTYAFDPETEIIVNIYPEELFMDLGLRLLKFLAIASFVFMAVGIILSKTAKIKYRL